MKVEKMDLILSGLGGQGILFITKIMSLTAARKGYNVLAAETHGMAQRGGSVISHLRIGKSKCSLINSRDADAIISLEENEAYRNLHFLTNGGKIYTNVIEKFTPPKQIEQYLNEEDIECNSIEASKTIQELSAPLSLNLAVLGYFFSFSQKLFSKEDVRATIEKVSPVKFKSINLKVFDICSNQSIQHRLK